MMYLYVLGLLIPIMERIVAEKTMQDSLGIHLQMSFAKDLFYIINRPGVAGAVLQTPP